MSTPEEDEVWRTIVENYGERPTFPEVDPDPGSAGEPGPGSGPGSEAGPEPGSEQAHDRGSDYGWVSPEDRHHPAYDVPRIEQPDRDPEELHERSSDHFVPPEPPPVPLPRGRRGAAWFGLFGVPVLLLLTIVLAIDLPGFVTFALLAWFVGGFVYLVATMRNDDTDGWDDGAVV